MYIYGLDIQMLYGFEKKILLDGTQTGSADIIIWIIKSVLSNQRIFSHSQFNNLKIEILFRPNTTHQLK